MVVTSPGNVAPVVNAGPDQILTLPTTTASLAGTVTDDGLPGGGGDDAVDEGQRTRHGDVWQRGRGLDDRDLLRPGRVRAAADGERRRGVGERH